MVKFWISSKSSCRTVSIVKQIDIMSNFFHNSCMLKSTKIYQILMNRQPFSRIINKRIKWSSIVFYFLYSVKNKLFWNVNYKEKNVAETLQLLNLFLTLMAWEYHSHFSWGSKLGHIWKFGIERVSRYG